ncbi:MAG: M13 family metallopeptidase [Proteobacteria bacterium]|nr:M13 family metallopeptidase [Pseudomonadota bacterium]
MDTSVAPGNDFFAYANGGWLKATEIPADRSSYGTGAILAELNTRRIRDLIEHANEPQARPVVDFYTTYLDEAGIEKRGTEPLEPILKRIDAIQDRKALARFMGESVLADLDILNNTQFHTINLFDFWIAADLNAPNRYVPYLLQGGLTMPDRDYYISSAASMVQIRKRHAAHVAAMLKLAKVADADAMATRIVALEGKIAAKHWTREQTEQVAKGNNPWTLQDLQKRAPGLDWKTFLAAAQMGKVTDFIAWQPTAIQGLSALVASESLATWKAWLQFHAIERVADTLPKAFVDEEFAFHGTTLTGAVEQQARWKRGIQATDDALGEAVGKLYVAKYFPPSEKARAEAMVAALIAAFGTRIDRLDWMSPQTRAKAKAKLSTLKVSVGYPDAWRDYSRLQVVKGDAYGNAERGRQFELQRNLGKLRHSVDRGEWVMNPQLVNAVNLPVMNAILFPAAILQPPYFDPKRPSAMDYAAAGAIIGHEISHSFDDQGALFDSSGKYESWWTPDDFAHFTAAAGKLADQYSQYKPFADLAVNGKQTLSENLADLAGLAVAYDAYHISLKGAQPPAVSGFSADQLFFLSFARSWRSKYREPALRQRIIADGHSPSQYRALTVRNLDPWYEAFDVKPGQVLYLKPENRVRIW